jgi:hypothetical protein
MLLGLALTAGFVVDSARGAEPTLVRSTQSGPWSAAETWDAGRVPAAGDRVIVEPGHSVLCGSNSCDVIRQFWQAEQYMSRK